MVIKVITYSNVLLINILLFILDSRSRRLHDFIFDVLFRTFLILAILIVFYVLILIITSHLLAIFIVFTIMKYYTIQYHTKQCSYDSVLYCKSYLLVFEYLSMTTVFILIHIDTYWPQSPIEHFAK